MRWWRHRVPGPHLHAAQLDVLLGDANHPGDRGLPPQELLDGRRDQRLVLDQPAPPLGVGGEVDEEALQRGAHRVEPRDQEEEADVEDLLAGEPLTLHLGDQEPADEVVTGLDVHFDHDIARSVDLDPARWADRSIPQRVAEKVSDTISDFF